MAESSPEEKTNETQDANKADPNATADQPESSVLAKVPFQVPEIPAKTKKALKELGFDISGIDGTFKEIVNWANSVESRIHVMAETLPDQTAKKVIDEIQRVALERQKQIQAQMQGQNMPQGQGAGGIAGSGIGVSDIIQGLKFIGGSGGGTPSEQFEKFQADMMNLTLENMKKRNLGEDIGNAFIKILTMKAAKGLDVEMAELFK